MRFVVPIYGGTVIRCTSTAELSRACKRLGLTAPSEAASGLCLQADGADGSVVYLLCWYNREASTLVHECVHLAQFVLIRAGIDPRDSNGETMAYLTGELFDRLKSR